MTDYLPNPLQRARLSLWTKCARIVCKSLYDDPLFELRITIARLVEAVARLSFTDGKGNLLPNASMMRDLRRTCAGFGISEAGYRQLTEEMTGRDKDNGLSVAVRCAEVLNEKFLLGQEFYTPPPPATEPPLPPPGRISADKIERAYAMHCLANGIRYGEIPIAKEPVESIDSLVEYREKLRAAGQFKRADEIRDQLAVRGIIVNDKTRAAMATTVTDADAATMAWNLEHCIVRTPSEYKAMQAAAKERKKP